MNDSNDGSDYRDGYEGESGNSPVERADWWKRVGGSDQVQPIAQPSVEVLRYSGEEQIFIIAMHPRRALALATAAKALNTTPEALLSTGWLMAMEWSDVFEMSNGLAEYQVPSSVPELRKLQHYGRGDDWDWLGREQVFVDDAGREERFPSAAEPQRLGGPARELWRIVQRTLFGGMATNEWSGTADELLEELKAAASPKEEPILPRTSSWLALRLEEIHNFRPDSLTCRRQDGRRVWTIRRSG